MESEVPGMENQSSFLTEPIIKIYLPAKISIQRSLFFDLLISFLGFDKDWNQRVRDSYGRNQQHAYLIYFKNYIKSSNCIK
ncbi:hypothetical protein COC46_04480 [Bacillus sp. AFS041924]|nr:hypothetical protein COC46_04480 [Bacillus sp. AFS041924]